jgi:hypothetical protein
MNTSLQIDLLPAIRDRVLKYVGNTFLALPAEKFVHTLQKHAISQSMADHLRRVINDNGYGVNIIPSKVKVSEAVHLLNRFIVSMVGWSETEVQELPLGTAPGVFVK